MIMLIYEIETPISLTASKYAVPSKSKAYFFSLPKTMISIANKIVYTDSTIALLDFLINSNANDNKLYRIFVHIVTKCKYVVIYHLYPI